MEKIIFGFITTILLSFNIYGMQKDSQTYKNISINLTKNTTINSNLTFKGLCKIYCNGFNFLPSEKYKIKIEKNSILIIFEPGQIEINGPGETFIGTLDKERGTEKYTLSMLTITQPIGYDSFNPELKCLLKLGGN